MATQFFLSLSSPADRGISRIENTSRAMKGQRSKAAAKVARSTLGRSNGKVPARLRTRCRCGPECRAPKLPECRRYAFVALAYGRGRRSPVWVSFDKRLVVWVRTAWLPVPGRGRMAKEYAHEGLISSSRQGTMVT